MKKLIKENIFWVCILASVALLLILCIILILPLINKKKELKEAINNKISVIDAMITDAGTFSMGKTQELNDKRDKLIADYNNAIDFYAGYDKILERWFEGLPPKPDLGSFDSKYKDHKNKLEAILRTEKIISGRGISPLNWSDEKLVDNITELKRIQKRYWIRERIINVIKEGLKEKLGIKHFKEIKFLGKIDSAEGSTEYALPDELGETLSFELSVDILYGDVLKFINLLINPGFDQKMLIKVRGCKIRMAEPLEEQKTIEYDDPEPAVTPNPISLTLTCEVIDFDTSKRKDFGQPAKPQ